MLHSGEFENPFADPRRDVSEFKRSHWEHASVDSFVGKVALESGLHTVAHNHVDIDVLYEPGGSKLTAVVFHGELPSTDVHLPVFADALGPGAAANRIYISDPGLYLDGTALWAGYEDSAGVPLSSVLPKIIRRLHEASGGTELIFVGEGRGAEVAERFAATFPGPSVGTPGMGGYSLASASVV